MYRVFCVLIFLSACKSLNTEEAKDQSEFNRDSSALREILYADSTSDSLNLNHHKPQMNDSVEHLAENTHINIEKIDFQLKDSCQLANKVRRIIVLYLSNKSDELFSPLFKDALEKNSQLDDIKCVFPRDNEELLLLYELTKRLEMVTQARPDAIRVVFKLFKYMDHAVEYVEHLHSVIPKLALANTMAFIQEVDKLSTSDRAIILENLEYLENLQSVERLRNNLLEVKDRSLKPTVDETKKAIDKIFEN